MGLPVMHRRRLAATVPATCAAMSFRLLLEYRPRDASSRLIIQEHFYYSKKNITISHEARSSFCLVFVSLFLVEDNGNVIIAKGFDCEAFPQRIHQQRIREGLAYNFREGVLAGSEHAHQTVVRSR